MTKPDPRLARLLSAAPRRGWAQTRNAGASMSMSRRRFLGTAGVGLGVVVVGPSLLAACGGGDSDTQSSSTTFTPTTNDSLRISNWPFYIDEETVGDFQDASGLSVTYTEDVNDNEEYFARIREPLSRGEDIGADLFIVTDFMVNRLIQLGWLAPIDNANVPNKANLVEALQNIPFDPDRTYSLPWASGFTSIAYNPQITGRAITSLNDLFDPEFAGKVTLMSDMRDGGGQIMLANGDSPAEATLEMIQAAADRVQEAKDQGQIRRFTGNDYGDDLVAGNVAIAQAYSGDVAQLKLDNPDLEFVFADEGMISWSDNMVMPISTKNSTGAEQWMDYVYDPEHMAQITAYVQYIPPVEGTGEALAQLPDGQELADNPLINPPADVRAKAIAWRGLTDEEDQEFSTVWNAVARG